MTFRLAVLTLRQNWHYLPHGLKLGALTASAAVIIGAPAAVLVHQQHAATVATPTPTVTTKNVATTGSPSSPSASNATTQSGKSDQSTTSTTTGTSSTTGKSTTPTSTKTTSPPSSGTTSGGGGTTTAPTPSGYPSASTTGPSGCSSYTQRSGTYTVTTANTVINCLQLNGTLDIEANNVTVQNSILTGTSWWGVQLGVTNTSATGLKLLHDKLLTVAGQGPDSGGYDYGVSPGHGGAIEVGYSDISGYKDGVDISTGSIHDSYIHNLSQFSGAHTQAVYVYAGGSGVQITDNTLINDTPISMSTAAIYIAPDSGHQNNVTVTGNKLAGGALTLYGGDSSATNIVVKNNVFSTIIFSSGGYYGTDGYWQAGNSGNIWSGNTWADGAYAGQTVSP